MAEGKMSIPSSIYIIIGVAVVLMSLVVGLNSTGIEKMSVFILVGAVFIVIGFLKFLMKEKKRVAHPMHHAAVHHAPAHHQAHHAAQHPQHAQSTVPHQGGPHPAVVAASHHANIRVKCPGCGIVVHPTFKFCHNCGHVLRK